MKDILECWPFPFKPRKNQIVALNWLQKQDAKYLLLESPVGSGKSAIGITYSIYLAQFKQPMWTVNKKGEEIELPVSDIQDSFILTPLRMLQEQYEVSVKGIDKIKLESMYGRSNYTCNTHRTTCDIGKELKPNCSHCPCEEARNRAKKADEAVMNYALALNLFAYTDGFNPRNLIIFDECHTLEEHLVNFGTLSIIKARCEKYKLPFRIPENLEDAFNWLKDVYAPKLNITVLDMKLKYDSLKENRDLKSKDKKFIKEYTSLSKHSAKTKITLRMDLEKFHHNFVFTKDKFKFEFKRLYGKDPFNHILEDMGNRFLFMSSTILDKKGFCEDLGFEPKDTAFLSLQSEFAVKNRKVMYIPQMKMNAKWQNPENAPGRKRMHETIEAILHMNEDHSGLIHTANFKIAEWLVERLDVPHKIYHHNPGSKVDRNDVINAYQDDPNPSVLISPSSTEGLDLKDELGRFAIVCKIPFGFLGDSWIKTRMDISGEWYKRQALIDIIQGGGRIVRTEEDWGTVFILDESWAYLYRTTNYMVPKWWKAAYFDKSK